jgi:D-alanine-D-alanine ligase
MSRAPEHARPDDVDTRVILRDRVTSADADNVRRIVSSSGFFSVAEVDVAVELVDERLRRGAASGYDFLFADLDAATVGYACYGPIACTVGSFDLYWIAVESQQRRCGLGRLLIEAVEQRVAQAAGRRIYIETSGRAQYAPTHAFYERCGYSAEAVLPDFYAPGDAKIIYSRAVAPIHATIAPP